MGHSHPAQLQHVAKALRRDDRRARTAPLEDGVRRDRRAVRNVLDPVRSQRPHRVDDGAVVRGRRRQDLRDTQPAVVALDDHVRERASDVGARARHGCGVTSASDGNVSITRSTAQRMLRWMTASARLALPRSQASRKSR